MIRTLLTLTMVLAIPMTALAQDAPPKKKKRKIKIVRKKQGGDVEIRRVLRAQTPGAPDALAIFYRAEGRPSSHWIGTACAPASPALLAQLRLESGLVVQQVIEKSPAAKAGLKKYDVLVSFNDKQLSSLGDLIKAVGSSKGKKSTLRLVRAGKARSIKVTPAKRPKNQHPAGSIINLQGLQHLHKHLPGIATDNAKLLFVRPGIAVDVPPKAIPGGVRVSMRKENGKTSLEIQKGGKKYSIKSKKDLKKLPKDIQAIAKPLWERGGKFVTSGATIYRLMPNGPRVIQGFSHAPGVAPKIRQRIEVRRSDDKLDAVLRELKRLRKEVDKLKRRNRRNDDDDDDDATT